ncbi:hypothetical protein QQF64_020577 [Cirrhinus molitorella]|uniref:Uncharacterized protein n=1 Tax=Cirrhinus molitorella TaxID=172907 RepID=A0ABR3L9K6_9TELE
MTTASTQFHTGTRSSFKPTRLALARLVTSRVHHSCCECGRSCWSGSGRAVTLLLFMSKGNFAAELQSAKTIELDNFDVSWMEL